MDVFWKQMSELPCFSILFSFKCLFIRGDYLTLSTPLDVIF